MERPMIRDKVQFTKEKETMLHIDYDISKQLKGVASWSMWKDIGPTIIATRAATFDQLTTRFLADHPDAVVLQVGCGMDSRVFRIDPPASVEWFDVDYPDVIDLRPQLLPEREAESAGQYHLIGAPL